MRDHRLWLGLTALLGLALLLGLWAPAGSQLSKLPSVENHGPLGLAVLPAWFETRGQPLRVHETAPDTLDASTQVFLIAAPTARTVTRAETLALEGWVRRGGTLVLLMPAPLERQPDLAAWLELSRAEGPSLRSEGVSDSLGATLEVRLPRGLLAGAAQLRTGGGAGLSCDGPGALPTLSGNGGCVMPLGEGEVWVFAGADLAENARLELKDNAQLWANVAARGRVAVDEFHQRPSAPVPTTTNLVATALQAGVLALFLLWAMSPRLGPPRTARRPAHRAAREYVEAMAALTGRAQVDGALITAALERFRNRCAEAFGTPPGSSWPELAQELARHGPVDPQVVGRLGAERDFLSLSRHLARLERQLRL